MLPKKVLVYFLLAALGQADAQEDHPVVGRYEGAKLVASHKDNFAEWKWTEAPLSKEPELQLNAQEGKLESFVYEAPAGRSSLEVFRNYEQQLKKGGFNVKFSCNGSNCNEKGVYSNFFVIIYGSDGNKLESKKGLSNFASYIYSGNNYLSAIRKAADQELYVSVATAEINDKVYIFLNVLQKEAMETDKVKVDADYLAKEIKSTGKVVIYDIQFETAKATLLPESFVVIDEMVKYIKTMPGKKFYIVGHTDDTGNFDMNLKLSMQRAESLVKELNNKGIALNQLIPQGVGPLSPLGDNRTEAGKKLNRRVELILSLN